MWEIKFTGNNKVIFYEIRFLQSVIQVRLSLYVYRELLRAFITVIIGKLQ